MSERGAYTKNIPSHPIVEYHPYTWEHYSQYNNKIDVHTFGKNYIVVMLSKLYISAIGIINNHAKFEISRTILTYQK